MFRIGEFAQIAQVSGRQLRFYDQLGLLQPAYIDRENGYRYYSVQQLPRLNRILALKELGLALEQIRPLLDDEIEPAELRRMLMMKRAEVERTLQVEELRLRHIESRIAQIDTHGAIENYDVVTKSVAAAPFLSLRQTFSGLDDASAIVCDVAVGGAKQIRPGLRDKFVVVSRTESETDRLDLEIGYTLTRPTSATIRIAESLVLGINELPTVETMATMVRQGTNAESHLAFGAIGIWIEANKYEIAGPCREVFLEPITGPPAFDKALVEIQFPVRLAT
jgi:DNA-binding transcriptional MerR regulator